MNLKHSTITSAILLVFFFLAGCQVAPVKVAEKNNDVTAKNTAVMKQWVAELNRSNLPFLQEVIHEDFVDHNPFPGVPANKAGYISLLTKAHHEWFPGIQVTIEDIVAGDDKVAVRLSVKAKHVGNVMGAPGTGKELSWDAYAIYRLKDGQLIDRWEMLDSFSFMSQLGLAKAAQ